MHILRRRGWELSERLATPEALVLGRRTALAGAGSVALAAPALAQAAAAPERNPKYVAGRDITPEKYATTYNNYYEFSEGKNLWEAAQVLKPRPWTISLEGELKQPRTIGIDDLLKQVQLEERVYRHRCVEAWAMTVPWTGFPLSQLVKIAEPLGSAKYVVFETAQDPKMPGLQSPFYPWPYIEGLAIDEAANELAFISTGMYGKPLPPQDGGPIRLTVPWKYGFKSGKALAKISFTEKRPVNFWQAIQPSEYGFWANVNPAVAHPRWSQAQERLLGSNEMVPTQIYNGYGEFVASLYSDRKNEKLFM
ncbi:MAG TPA: protein-methionine-sulfoxide reductase catalytic subunit MsrP [Acetobacteraceae bacterium]|nr:protein-methionine-sulfoxide reductase catalytic subunit MsrP [Acetobacteraceae bacterium]